MDALHAGTAEIDGAADVTVLNVINVHNATTTAAAQSLMILTA